MNNSISSLTPIGHVHSIYRTIGEAPRQGTNEHATIEIFPDFEQGLQDIEEFSHLYIVYWLHQSSGYTLIVQPPWQTGRHGLFTTRSPHRPNPLGLSVVQLVKRTQNILEVTNLDAIEGTPVLDIKPYIKRLDCHPDSTDGWAENLESK